MARAWRITEDLLADNPDPGESAVGTEGPHGAPGRLFEALRHDRGHRFEMFDDDGILYYRGLTIFDVGPEGLDDYELEAALGGPLWDFGEPDSGCTRITYPGHPEWEIG